MSASVAGKFQDHYDLLGIDPKSDLETIQSVYEELAAAYHPDTPETGDLEAYEAIELAYQVLTDPGLRREFDKLIGLQTNDDEPAFSGAEFFGALSRGATLRSTLLCVLYDRRRTNPRQPGLNMRNVEAMLETGSDELQFALWYLKQRRFILSDDKSKLQITVEGMDFLEQNPPDPNAVMAFIR